MVTYRPSRPDIGDVFTPKTIETVGSSTCSAGIGRGSSGPVMVSPMVMSSMPARQMMSPAAARWTSIRSRPLKTYSFVTRVRSILPVTLETAIVSPVATRPLTMRPIAMRPR